MENETMARHPMMDHLEREQAALLDKIPEWKADPKRAVGDMAEIRAGLVKHYGFDPAHLEVIPNHQSVLLARDALEARKLRAQVEQMKAERNKGAAAAKASAADQERDEGFKKRIADARQSPGGKQDRREMIADWVESKGNG
jgi:hypothetical protein